MILANSSSSVQDVFTDTSGSLDPFKPVRKADGQGSPADKDASMKHFHLAICVAMTILLTSFVFTHAGWLAARRTTRVAGRHSEARGHARPNDLFGTDAARRWRNCEPAHWRGYMLQH
jgi:hypothetical protein